MMEGDGEAWPLLDANNANRTSSTSYSSNDTWDNGNVTNKHNDGGITSSTSHTFQEWVIYSRFQSLSGVCLYVSVAGTTYAYGVFSPLLQHRLGYSQQSLDFIASLGNAGLYLSFFTGMAMERVGFKKVVFFGGLCIMVGFLCIWLAIHGAVSASVTSVACYYFVAQIGVCCHISTAVAVVVKLFPPQSRGAAVGLVKGYFGLSSAVLADLADGFTFLTDPSIFLLFVASFVPAVGIMGSSITNILPEELVDFSFEESRSLPTTLSYFQFHWCILWLMLLLAGYTGYALDATPLHKGLTAAFLLVILFFLLLVPNFYGNRTISMEEIESNNGINNSNNDSNNNYAHGDVLPTTPTSNTTCTSIYLRRSSSNISYRSISRTNSNTFGGEGYGYDMPIFESIQTWRLWCLFYVFMVTSGAGLMVIYNVNAIALATRRAPSNFFISLIALASGAGRLLSGMFSDFLVKHSCVTRLQFLALIVFLMSIMHWLLSLGSADALVPCFLSVGLLFGSAVSLIAVIVTDLFGDKYIATNFGFIDTSPVFGSYIFATYVVNVFYHTNSTATSAVGSGSGSGSGNDVTEGGDGASGEIAICIGEDCFQRAFQINACTCLMGGMLCLLMDYLTSIRYQSVETTTTSITSRNGL